MTVYPRQYSPIRRSRLSTFAVAFIAQTLLLSLPAHAQSLNDIADDDQYLRGLIELQLPEVLEQHIKMHPPANEVQGALYEVATQRMTLAAGELSGDDRRLAVDALLEARRDLIVAAAANDPRKPVWMADLATDLLFELFPADGAGLTALFGVSPPQQLERIASAAAEVLTLSQEAEDTLNRVLLDLQGNAKGADDFALQQRRRELIERERQRRLPFLRNVGLVLNAELNSSDAASARIDYQQAARELPAFAESLTGGPAILAELYLGLALARLGEFDTAESHFAAIAKNQSATAADIFFARMGGVINRTVRGGPRSGLEALTSIKSRYADAKPENIFYRVLIADHEFLLHARLSREAAPEQQQALAAQAFHAYAELINANFGPTISRQSLRAIALARMADAIAFLPQNLSLDQLPPLVRIAQAERQARDAGAREQAIVALEAELNSPVLETPDRAAALFILAKALLEDGHNLFAARRFIELARDFPGESQAETAIELGLAISADLHRRNVDDAEARAAQHEALAILFAKYPNLKSIDRWRYAAGRLAVLEEDFDEAQKLFAQIAPDASEWLDSHYMQAVAARGFAQSASKTTPSRSAHEQTLATIERVTPVIEKGLAQAAEAQRQSGLRDYLTSLRILRAQTLVDLNRPQEALDSLAQLQSSSSINSSITAQILKARISAHQALRQPEAALRDIEQFFETSPDNALVVMEPMLASFSADVQALIDDDREDEARELAERGLLPIAELIAKWVDGRNDPTTSQQFALPLAEAYRLSGRYQDALEWHKRMEPQHADAAPALMNRAECLFALGGDTGLAEAMTIYKRLIAAGPDAVGRNNYWLAQLRTLQILDRAKRRTEQIIPQIERLKQHDPNLGGERYRRGFDALRMKYAR